MTHPTNNDTTGETVSSDYCMFPNQCGIGMDCSPCMQAELGRRAARITELEQVLTDILRERQLHGDIPDGAMAARKCLYGPSLQPKG